MRRGRSTPIAIAAAVLFAAEASAAADAAQTQRLIDAAPNGASAFRAAPDDGATHVQSGMRCRAGGPQLRLVGVSVSPSAPVGDDVTCAFSMPGYSLTLRAVRAPGRTAEQAAPDVVAAIMAEHPDAKPIRNAPVATLPGIADAASGSYAVTADGRARVTTVWLAREGEWLIQVRATYDERQRQEAELFGSVLQATAQQSVLDATPAERLSTSE